MTDNLDTTLATMFASDHQTAPAVIRRSVRRRLVDWTHQSRIAASMLRPLPRPGQVVSGLLGNGIALGAFVPALQQLAGVPLRLDISTLGVNHAGIDLLAEMLEAGTLAEVRMLFSVYFRTSDAETCAYATDRLRRLGQRVSVERVHCKLILAAPIGRRDRYTLESSANLRSCVCLEQFSLSNSRSLYSFHRRWFDRYFPK